VERSHPRKYGTWRNLQTRTHNKLESNWWEIIRSASGEMWFNNNLEWKLGNGEKVLFCEDKWVGREA